MYECHKGSQCVHSFPRVVQFQVTESVNLREIQKSSCLLEIYHTCLSAKVFHESRCELWYLNMWMPLSETWGLTWGMQGGGEGLCCSGNKSYDKGGCIWFSPLLPHQAPWAIVVSIYHSPWVKTLGQWACIHQATFWTLLGVRGSPGHSIGEKRK